MLWTGCPFYNIKKLLNKVHHSLIQGVNNMKRSKNNKERLEQPFEVSLYLHNTGTAEIQQFRQTRSHYKNQQQKVSMLETKVFSFSRKPMCKTKNIQNQDNIKKLIENVGHGKKGKKIDRRMVTNYCMFVPPLPRIREKTCCYSLSLTEERQEKSHTLDMGSALSKEKDEKMRQKRESFQETHDCPRQTGSSIERNLRNKAFIHQQKLQFQENAISSRQENNPKKFVNRVRRKRVQNQTEIEHVIPRKRVSMFDIQGPKAMSINPSRLPHAKKKLSSYLGNYATKLQVKKPPNQYSKSRKEKEAFGFGGWDNLSNSSADSFS